MRPVKKIALLHDICGVGKAAMMNMTPILSMMGIEACPIPTVLLSTHTGGYGTPASADYAEAMHKEIKTALYEIFGEKEEEIPVLYGGSVNPGNAESLIVQPSIDGLFVGRAAWDADKFNTLMRDAMKVYAERVC